MALLFELRDGAGTRVWFAGELDDLPHNRLPDVDYIECPTLAGVDRFGTTTFNDRQMAFLVNELELILARRPLADGSAALLQDLLSACRRGSERAHWRLIVTGD